MEQLLFDWMSPQERIARYRINNPLPEKERPWERYKVTPEEQAELDHIKATQGANAALTRWRVMRDAAQAKAQQK